MYIQLVRHRLFRGALFASTLALSACAFGGGNAADDGQQDMIMDSQQRKAVIEGIITQLTQYYVYADKAQEVASALQAQLKKGQYDNVKSAKALAAELSAELKTLTNDQHLEVRYFEEIIADEPHKSEPSVAEVAMETQRSQFMNFGFRSVERLHGNVGYLNLQSFDRPQNAEQKIVAAMSLLSDTKALIIDLRNNGGGDPDTVMIFASYFFDQPTHLNDIYWRAENRTDARWTQPQVSGKRYGTDREIYILTSHDTFSAPEDFAYALKYAGRAKIVGEATGGGAHPGEPRRVSAHFKMFVPSGRAINPVTLTDWENVGVQPDINVSADDALKQAHIAALKKLIATESDPGTKQRLERSLERVN